MKRKVARLVVSGWMAAILLLASCAPAAVQEPEKKAPPVKEKEVPREVAVPKEVVVPEKKADMVKWKGTKLDGTVVEKSIEKPRYGGTLTVMSEEDFPTGPSVDSVINYGGNWHVRLASESLLQKDRLRGPAGTGEWSGLYNVYPGPSILTRSLADSIEIIDPDTLVYHIRKGISWQDKPPVNGAAFTPGDVVATVVRYYTAPAGWTSRFPYISDLKHPENSIYIAPDDPWKVIVKSAPNALANAYQLFTNRWFIIPAAVAEDGTFKSWTEWVGTGPFIIKDYVQSSAALWERNPAYWDHDPLFPENQLPYVDSVKMLVIPDMSTQTAALRAGKVDQIQLLDRDSALTMMKTNPELLYQRALGDSVGLNMRHDVKPFDDVRVRRAMMMAIDHDAIVRDFYEGDAEKFYYPAYPIAEESRMFVPLEKMPEVVQQMFGYHPDIAKQLLAEAGYAKGFKTSALVWRSSDVDLLSIVKDYWSKVGVDLEIIVKEQTVFNSIWRKGAHEHGVFASSGGVTTPFRWTYSRQGTPYNQAKVNSPLVEDIIVKTNNIMFTNEDEFFRIIREASPALNLEAQHIYLPVPYEYSMWQPWLKGYHGERYAWYLATHVGMAGYVWIDQELKEAMKR